MGLLFFFRCWYIFTGKLNAPNWRRISSGVNYHHREQSLTALLSFFRPAAAGSRSQRLGTVPDGLNFKKRGSFIKKGEFQGVFCKPFYFSIRIEDYKIFYIYKKRGLQTPPHFSPFPPFFPLFDFAGYIQLWAYLPLPTLFEFAVCVRASLRPLPQRRAAEMYTAPMPSEIRIVLACSRFAYTPFLLSEGNFTAKGSGAHRGARASVRKTDGWKDLQKPTLKKSKL